MSQAESAIIVVNYNLSFLQKERIFQQRDLEQTKLKKVCSAITFSASPDSSPT